MSFSRAQQGLFRPLLERAWAVECGVRGWTVGDKDAARDWYENEMETATGCRSSKQCNATTDFESAMAHFEIIEGASIEWQIQKETGNERRIMFEVKKSARDFECDRAYLIGIAKQALGVETVAAWRDLGAEERRIIIRAVVIHIRRQAERGDPTDHPRRRQEVEQPF